MEIPLDNQRPLPSPTIRHLKHFMMTRFLLAGLFAAVLSFAATLVPASAQYLNGQSASSVLGQSNFTGSFAAVPPTAQSQSGPRGLAIDRNTGAVFVCDGGNNRILRYASTAALTTGAAAEAVLGQPNFTSLTAATTQAGLNTPHGIFVDGNGTLWVADTNNNRVVWFEDAATKTNGANADGVLGQGTFTTSNTGNAATGLNKPRAVTVSPNGILYVSDSGNHRVLRYAAAPLVTNGASALQVFGQSAFGTGAASTGANRMNDPAGIAFDADLTLWVADAENNRVLGFTTSAQTGNGPSADLVFGQTNFSNNSPNGGSAGFFRPEGVYYDGQFNDEGNSLYVADRANHRVMIYSSPTQKASGAAADRILGSSWGTSASLFNNPAAIVRTNNFQLLVADRSNNRTLRFAPVSVPSMQTSRGSLRIKVKRKGVAVFTLTNTNFAGAYRLSIPRSNRNVAVAATFANGGTTAVLPVGGTQTVSITFRGKKITKRAATFVVSATAVATPNLSASATTKVTIRK